MGTLLHLGIVCSEYMKTIRVDKAAKDILTNLNKQTNIIYSSI